MIRDKIDIDNRFDIETGETAIDHGAWRPSTRAEQVRTVLADASPPVASQGRLEDVVRDVRQAPAVSLVCPPGRLIIGTFITCTMLHTY